MTYVGELRQAEQQLDDRGRGVLGAMTTLCAINQRGQEIDGRGGLAWCALSRGEVAAPVSGDTAPPGHPDEIPELAALSLSL